MEYNDFKTAVQEIELEKNRLDKEINNLRKARLMKLIPYEEGDAVTVLIKKNYSERWTPNPQKLEKGKTYTAKVKWYPHLTKLGKTANVTFNFDNGIYASFNTKDFDWI